MRRTPEINARGTRPPRRSSSSTTSTSASPRRPRAGSSCPNIKDADRCRCRSSPRRIGELTATAREGRTQPAEMAGGTITITNVGVFGVDAGTPIINPGESAILGVRRDHSASRGWSPRPTARDRRAALASPRWRCRSTTGSSTARSARSSSPTSPRSSRTRGRRSSSEPTGHFVPVRFADRALRCATDPDRALRSATRERSARSALTGTKCPVGCSDGEEVPARRACQAASTSASRSAVRATTGASRQSGAVSRSVAAGARPRRPGRGRAPACRHSQVAAATAGATPRRPSG